MPRPCFRDGCCKVLNSGVSSTQNVKGYFGANISVGGGANTHGVFK